MARSGYHKRKKSQRQREQSAQPFMGVPGIVAANDDPEHRHRIKVIIPHMNNEDEQDKVFDEWVEQMGGFAGSGGYGSFDIPRKGTEVLLFSEWGQGERLFYLAIYNETNLVPGDFNDETARGMRSDGDMKFICSGDLILEGGRILMKSAFGTMQIDAAAGIIFHPKDEGGSEV